MYKCFVHIAISHVFKIVFYEAICRRICCVFGRWQIYWYMYHKPYTCSTHTPSSIHPHMHICMFIHHKTHTPTHGNTNISMHVSCKSKRICEFTRTWVPHTHMWIQFTPTNAHPFTHIRSRTSTHAHTLAQIHPSTQTHIDMCESNLHPHTHADPLQCTNSSTHTQVDYISNVGFMFQWTLYKEACDYDYFIESGALRPFSSHIFEPANHFLIAWEGK